jgi:hypothetical protein
MAESPRVRRQRVVAKASGAPIVHALPWAAGEGPVVVTGVCGRLGKGVARVLHRVRPVIGVDRRPFPDKPKDLDHQQVDIRRKKLKDVFRAGDIQAVIHLGVMHDPRASATEHHSWNVAGFAKLLEYVAQFRIPKLVVLSSANVYGPQPDNPQFLSEEAPLLGGASFSEIRDLIEVDMLAQSFFWKHPETETVVLRPVHILGSVRNAASNFLRLPTVPDAPRLRPDGASHPRVGRRPGDPARTEAERPRDLQRRRARCAAALARREDPRAAERAGAVNARQDCARANVVAPPRELPGAGARSHPLRLHGGRQARARSPRILAQEDD